MAEIRQRLWIIGRDFNPGKIQEIARLFGEPHRRNGYLAPRVERDRAYGPDPRHRLDVHTLVDPVPASRAVVLFVHGGAYSMGDKRQEGTPYFDHVGGWATRCGMLAVTMNYRLAPHHGWPVGAEDVAAAVAWTRSHITEYGGDPERLVLVGYSAGATHVASFLAGHAGRPADAVASAIMMAGVYDVKTAARTEPHRSILASYFGDDETTYAGRSALPGLADSAVPMLFTVGEFDRLAQEQLTRVVVEFFDRRGILPALAWLPGHTHTSDIFSLGLEADSILETLLRQFITHTTRLSD